MTKITRTHDDVQIVSFTVLKYAVETELSRETKYVCTVKPMILQLGWNWWMANLSCTGYESSFQNQTFHNARFYYQSHFKQLTNIIITFRDPPPKGKEVYYLHISHTSHTAFLFSKLDYLHISNTSHTAFLFSKFFRLKQEEEAEEEEETHCIQYSSGMLLELCVHTMTCLFR